MLNTLIPLFDDKMMVKGYSVFSQKSNPFLDPLDMSTKANDGANQIPEMELIRAMGTDTIADDVELFVPVNNVAIFSDIAAQMADIPIGRIVLLIDSTCAPIPTYVDRVKELKEQGFRFAIRKVAVLEMGNYAPLFAYMDYVFLNNKKIDISKGRIFFEKLFPQIKLVAGNIDNQELYETLRDTGAYRFYEGDFYRVPLTKGVHEVTPVKYTYLELLRVVNQPDYELTDAADIIGHDPALTVSFLQMVNRAVKMSEIKSIRHAATMLGQKEMKRWITTAASKELYSDKPGEVTRLSLIRARFAENLAEEFGLKAQSDSLFMMGLFSVIDVIMEKPMAEAIEMVGVSGAVAEALVSHTGVLAPVYDFILHYEIADWQEVSRQLVLNHMEIERIENAYPEALQWYRSTIMG